MNEFDGLKHIDPACPPQSSRVFKEKRTWNCAWPRLHANESIDRFTACIGRTLDSELISTRSKAGRRGKLWVRKGGKGIDGSGRHDGLDGDLIERDGERERDAAGIRA